MKKNKKNNKDWMNDKKILKTFHKINDTIHLLVELMKQFGIQVKKFNKEKQK